jgi:hypothetical protein
MALYDTIGGQNAQVRRPDHRIASAIEEALGDGTSVVNIGAGIGAYEPPDRTVIAVEPSSPGSGCAGFRVPRCSLRNRGHESLSADTDPLQRRAAHVPFDRAEVQDTPDVSAKNAPVAGMAQPVSCFAKRHAPRRSVR